MLNNPRPGPGTVNEYLVSAIPWVTSSVINGVVKYSFPGVTSFITVKNHSGSAEIRFGFTQNGVTSNPTSNAHYIPLSTSESYTGAFRIKDLFVSASGNTVAVVAGLTVINYSDFPVLTASVTGSVYGGLG